MNAVLNQRQLIDGAALVGPSEKVPPALLELLAVIWRRKGLVLATALAALIFTGAILTLVPKRHEAVAEVLVDTQGVTHI